ncbi:actin remodeling regulator NHS-like isoform X2 [Branchiostoma lanceolatum]|uniref:actin remodeling regulator NHS-like isoform X2 n=1 Tax=Branchiostoma lanceolatum TaxID=7740 RepID=UPI00345462F3
MPFPKRSVKPEALGERPGSGPGAQVGPPAVWDDLDAVTNSMLAGTLRQLADLLKNATDIFDDLDSELHGVACRSERLLTRIENVEDKVTGLDARSVPIPLTTLDAVAKLHEHHHNDYVVQTELFQPPTRPECVKTIHENARKNLREVLRTCDKYRNDGRPSSRLYSTGPVFADLKPADNSDDWEEYKERKWQELQRVPTRPRPKSGEYRLNTLDIQTNQPNQPLPTPEEALRKNAVPSAVVPVDISGSVFDRMSRYRRSLIHQTSPETRRRKKKRSSSERRRRRQTVTGVPENIKKELSLVRQKSQRSNRSMYLNDTISSMDETATEIPSSPERWNRSLERDSHHRSRRRTRSNRSKTVAQIHLPPELLKVPQVDEMTQTDTGEGVQAGVKPSQRDIQTATENGESSAESTFASSPFSPTQPNGGVPPLTADNTVLRKSQPWVASSAARPRSLEIEPTELKQVEVSTNIPGVNSSQLSNAALPMSATTVSIHNKNTEQVYLSDSSTLTPSPIFGSPIAHAVVQMRNRKNEQTKEENRSSSGNWSGTSSARHSMTSDTILRGQHEIQVPVEIHNTTTFKDTQPEKSNLQNCHSASDSALSINDHHETDSLSSAMFGDESRQTTSYNTDTMSSQGTLRDFSDSTLKNQSGYSSSTTTRSVVTPSQELQADFTAMDSESWLRSVTEDAKNRSLSQSSNDTTGFGWSWRDVDMSDRQSVNSSKDDSSVYSVDQDGYYTSFHLDSGLKTFESGQNSTLPSSRVKRQLTYDGSGFTEGMYDEMMAGFTHTTSNRSSYHDGYNTLPNRASYFSTETVIHVPSESKSCASTLDRKKKKPPPPPKRTVTLQRSLSFTPQSKSSPDLSGISKLDSGRATPSRSRTSSQGSKGSGSSKGDLRGKPNRPPPPPPNIKAAVTEFWQKKKDSEQVNGDTHVENERRRSTCSESSGSAKSSEGKEEGAGSSSVAGKGGIKPSASEPKDIKSAIQSFWKKKRERNKTVGGRVSSNGEGFTFGKGDNSSKSPLVNGIKEETTTTRRESSGSLSTEERSFPRPFGSSDQKRHVNMYSLCQITPSQSEASSVNGDSPVFMRSRSHTPLFGSMSSRSRASSRSEAEISEDDSASMDRTTSFRTFSIDIGEGAQSVPPSQSYTTFGNNVSDMRQSFTFHDFQAGNRSNTEEQGPPVEPVAARSSPQPSPPRPSDLPVATTHPKQPVAQNENEQSLPASQSLPLPASQKGTGMAAVETITQTKAHVHVTVDNTPHATVHNGTILNVPYPSSKHYATVPTRPAPAVPQTKPPVPQSTVMETDLDAVLLPPKVTRVVTSPVVTVPPQTITSTTVPNLRRPPPVATKPPAAAIPPSGLSNLVDRPARPRSFPESAVSSLLSVDTTQGTPTKKPPPPVSPKPNGPMFQKQKGPPPTAPKPSPKRDVRPKSLFIDTRPKPQTVATPSADVRPKTPTSARFRTPTTPLENKSPTAKTLLDSGPPPRSPNTVVDKRSPTTKAYVDLTFMETPVVNGEHSAAVRNGGVVHRTSEVVDRGPDEVAAKSPTLKTTDDLFAVIHQAKKRLTIHVDPEDGGRRARSASPAPRAVNRTETRKPSSPAPAEPTPRPKSRLGPKNSTSREDFKALLLKNGMRLDPSSRMSAAEKLRKNPMLTRQRSPDDASSTCSSIDDLTDDYEAERGGMATMKDLKSVMSNTRSHSRTSDLGLFSNADLLSPTGTVKRNPKASSTPKSPSYAMVTRYTVGRSRTPSEPMHAISEAPDEVGSPEYKTRSKSFSGLIDSESPRGRLMESIRSEGDKDRDRTEAISTLERKGTSTSGSSLDESPNASMHTALLEHVRNSLRVYPDGNSQEDVASNAEDWD